MIDNQRRVGHNNFIPNKRGWNNCVFWILLISLLALCDETQNGCEGELSDARGKFGEHERSVRVA